MLELLCILTALCVALPGAVLAFVWIALAKVIVLPGAIDPDR